MRRRRWRWDYVVGKINVGYSVGEDGSFLSVLVAIWLQLFNP